MDGRGARPHTIYTNMDWNSRRITAIIENALNEDRATSDATSYACIDPNQRASATIIAKQECILAGLGCVARILDVYAERMAGIATTTRKFVDAVEGTRVRILDTRKTAPGLRLIDKHAVRCGGGQNHRLDLSDGVLIKGNHIALAGGIIPALERAIRNRRGRQPIEIEVRSLEELQQALESGAEAILLDNVSIETVRKAVEICSRQPRRIPLECAGGINLENVRSYAETGVDFISVGALTQSATAVDISLRVTPA